MTVGFAQAAVPEQKSVLVCEPRRIYAESLVSAVKELGVHCKLVSDEFALYEEMKGGEWSFVFVAAPLYDNVRIIGLRLNPSIRPVCLVTEFDDAPAGRGASILVLPARPPAVEDILNGRETSAGAMKRPSGPDARSLIIEGLDVQKGIVQTGGPESYVSVLSVFMRDAFEKLGKMRESLEADDLSGYATHAHALKSAAAYIGAFELSEAARELERAGKEGDAAFVGACGNAFFEKMEGLIVRISGALKTGVHNR
ncbi:MAG: Hpt domain-containing protein [Oscillospiraceae bacterium]|jgi:HPt (histidine-containing phosphotransfer) domain-containing protein|nr:Hpt domain-containing protein [Oscillospiraceae bacterium]